MLIAPDETITGALDLTGAKLRRGLELGREAGGERHARSSDAHHCPVAPAEGSREGRTRGSGATTPATNTSL